MGSGHEGRNQRAGLDVMADQLNHGLNGSGHEGRNQAPSSGRIHSGTTCLNGVRPRGPESDINGIG